MKRSNYNVYFKYKSRCFLFNTLQTTSIKLDTRDYAALSGNRSIKSELFSSKDVYSILRKRNYVVDQNINELKNLIKNYKAEQSSHATLTITVAPSLKCNFKCAYCYENKTSQTMGVNEQELLLQFIENKLNLKYQKLNLVWFGGEPLLCFDTITNLSLKIRKLCKKYRVKYHGFITTNGYLLTVAMIRKFKQLKINQVFITLDGVGKVHDNRRKLLSGHGSFNKIVKNIRLLKRYGIKVLIRMNVDRSNLANAEALGAFVNNNLGLPFYLGHVRQYTESCDPDTKKYLSRKEYATAAYKFNMNRQKHVDSGKTVESFRPLKNYCRACGVGTYVVDPSLNLYKCENDIGNVSKSLGNIKNMSRTSVLNTPSVDRYLNWNPFEFEKCRKCLLLPLCMGGCPFIGLKNSEPECDTIKFTVNDCLKTYLKQKYDLS